MPKKGFNRAIVVLAGAAAILAGNAGQEAALQQQASRQVPEQDAVRNLVVAALHGATRNSEVLPYSAECQVALVFHSDPKEIERSEYWLQFLLDDLPPYSEFPRQYFCAQHSSAWLAAPCPVTNGLAWCGLNYGFSEPPSYLSIPATRAIDVVVTASGLANARNGIVYLTAKHSALTFRHELGHALGLADEYAMRADLATAFCSGEYDFQALNIVVTSSRYVTDQEYRQLKANLPWLKRLEQEPGVQQADGDWRLGSPGNDKIGLFPAATCENSEYYAWKPVAELTFMEQHEIGAVPELYWWLIKQAIAQH